MESIPSKKGPSETSQNWRVSILVCASSIVAVVCLFYKTAIAMVALWRTSIFSHGFLILPISLYLIWRRRRQLASLSPTANPGGLGLLGVLAGVWFLGNLAGVQLIQQLALVAMLPGLVWTILGTAVIRELLFPLAFLFFAVPMGESLIPPLQRFTAFFALKGLELSGVPAVLEGRFLLVPSGTWEVAETCSGIRYLLSSMAVGCLYAWLVFQSLARRVAFVALFGVVSILANGLRAYGIILLGHLSNNRIAAGVDHFIYGWLFFSVITVSVFALGWRWRQAPADPSAQVDAQSQPTGTRYRVAGNPGAPRGSLRAQALTAVVAIALLALAPISAYSWRNQPEIKSPGIAVPAAALPWTSLPEYSGNWTTPFAGSDVVVRRTYQSGDKQVHVQVAFSASGRKELIHGKNDLADEDQWIQLTEDRAQAMVDRQTLTVRAARIASAQGNRLVWSWYWLAGEFTSSPYRAKLLQLKARLFGGPPGAAWILIATDFRPDAAAAAAVLQDFLQHASIEATLNGMPE